MIVACDYGIFHEIGIFLPFESFSAVAVDGKNVWETHIEWVKEKKSN